MKARLLLLLLLLVSAVMAPEAARIVLRSGMPIVLSPLNISRQARFTKAWYDEIVAVDTPITRLVRDHMGPGFVKWPDRTPLMYDQVAAAYLVDPTLTIAPGIKKMGIKLKKGVWELQVQASGVDAELPGELARAFVRIGDVEGTVEAQGLFTTKITTPTIVTEPCNERSTRGTAAASRRSWLRMPARLEPIERTIEGSDDRMPRMPAPAMPPTPMIRT